MRVDVIGGMVSAVAIAFAIVVVAAATLHPRGLTNIDTPTQAAEALRPVVGNAAGFVFALGIVGLGLLAVPVLAGANAYALSEAFDWHEGLSRRLSDARGFYAVVAGSMLTGMVVGFAGVDPIHALYLAAIGNGLAAPPLLALVLVLTRDRALLGDFRSHALSPTVVGLALLISVALPVAYLLVR
jgi:Mn2+/Fe2+ NRAMP family transporter